LEDAVTEAMMRRGGNEIQGYLWGVHS
jgi:hypothetical protein